MGYDMTYHPISDAQMKRYVLCLGSDDYAAELCDEAALSDDNKSRFLNMLASFRPPSDSGFDRTHGAYIAITQGFFAKYHYVRGSMLSGVGSTLAPYLQPWGTALPELPETQNAANVIQGEFSSGVYIAPNKVLAFMEDVHAKPDLAAAVAAQFPPAELDVLWTALLAAQQQGLGLLEAAGVVQQYPEDPSTTTCFSDIANCDPAGIELFKTTAAATLAAVPQAPATSSAEWQQLAVAVGTPYGIADQLVQHFNHECQSTHPLAAFTSVTAGMGVGIVLDWKEGYLLEQRCRDIVDQHIGWSDEDFWRMDELQFSCGEVDNVDHGLGAFAGWLQSRGSGHTLVSTTTNADYFFSILHPQASAAALIPALAACGIESHVQAAAAADVGSAIAPASQEAPLPWQTQPEPNEDIRKTAGTERGLSARLRARRDADGTD